MAMPAPKDIYEPEERLASASSRATGSRRPAWSPTPARRAAATGARRRDARVRVSVVEPGTDLPAARHAG